MLALLSRIILIIFISTVSFLVYAEETNTDYVKTNWSFKGIFGTLIALHFKEVIRFIRKFAQDVIQLNI